MQSAAKSEPRSSGELKRLRECIISAMPHDERPKSGVLRMRARSAILHLDQPAAPVMITLLVHGSSTVERRPWRGAFRVDFEAPLVEGATYRMELDDGREGYCVVEQVRMYGEDRVALVRKATDLRTRGTNGKSPA